MRYELILDRIYSVISPYRAAERRLRKLEELRSSGQLENLCSSEVHALFGITKEM